MFTAIIYSSAQYKEVTEIAIYRISEAQNKNFEKLLKDFKNEVSSLKGYKTYETHSDLHYSNIYVDVLTWSNINNALAASESVKTAAKYKPFTNARDSLIGYGEFYLYKQFIHNKNNLNMTNKVTEVVIYQIKAEKVNAYNGIAETVNHFVKEQPGFISRKVMQDHKDPSMFVDLVEWASQADAENAMQKSQQETSLLPFFEAIEKIITFSHYSFFK